MSQRSINSLLSHQCVHKCTCQSDVWKNQTIVPSWVVMSRALLLTQKMNGASQSLSIVMPAFVPVSANFVKLSVVTIDGDSDASCWNNTPLETLIGGYAKDGSFQKQYVYNTPKTGSGSFSGDGWSLELPIQDRNIYILKPSACVQGSGSGMNLYLYLEAYM